MKFKTEQEDFWSGNFGDNYILRNRSETFLQSNINFFKKALKKVKKIDSMIEFGANVGMNIKAIKSLGKIKIFKAIEINKKACFDLEKVIGKENVFQNSILDYKNSEKFDLVLTKTVLIHINPEKLVDVYRKIYKSAKKYVLIAEYYNPSPSVIEYRGFKNKLFKRDFAGELIDLYPDLQILDYGFVYHRDQFYPQDDINWFLLKKNN
tara:strand:- start:6723 stop:7346 length:624 start_codon:yes stop_codon:yes gene_type:complete